jgi:uncharacterized membrane protein/thiol-disulfide isomerase/thioredoxin
MRAVLFYSPTCGHCEYVINETLMPMLEKYGSQLQIFVVDVSQPASQELFGAALQKFGLEQGGVPFLVFENTYLVGSGDIPEKFPGLVETYLAQGSLDWPEIPGLAEALTVPYSPEPTPASTPVVRAVLFYRSACSHCQKLTEEVIPPLREKYGAQLEIFGVDASSSEGNEIYHAAIERFEIERIGVPTLILGDQVFVGGTDIEERFANVIEEYFTQGGMDWPDIPGLQELIANASEAEATAAPGSETDSPSPVSAEETPGGLLTHSESSTWLDTFAQDPAGNTLSVIVLIGMFSSVGWAITLFWKSNNVSRMEVWRWIVPLLCLIGFAVAGYLAYVETARVDAVCGPVGDCNTVQQSEYARLFGLLPIGVLGLIGYAAIFAAWLVGRYAKDRFAGFGVVSLFAMTVVGTLFSIYLTFLEPFVIGATCAWCLTSAGLMTILMLLTVRPAKTVLSGFAQPRS